MAEIDLLDVPVYLTGLAAICSFLFFKKFDRVERYFVYYICLSIFFELLAMYLSRREVLDIMAQSGIENSLPGLHLFTLLQFIFLSFFFKEVLNLYKVILPWKWILLIGTLLIIANSIFVQSIFAFNSYSKTAVELLIIIASMTYFARYMLSDKIEKQNSVLTFFVTAVFVNASLSILIHLFSNALMEKNESFIAILWKVRGFGNLVTQLIILYGIFLVIKRGSVLEKNLNLEN